MNSIVALPIVAAMPITAPAMPSDIDPTFRAIENCRNARNAQYAAYEKAKAATLLIDEFEARCARERAICDGPSDAAFEAFSDFCEVKPTTTQGLLAKLGYAGELQAFDSGIFDFYRSAPIIQHLAADARLLSDIDDLAPRSRPNEFDPIYEALETWRRAKAAIEAVGDDDDEAYDDAGAQYWAACLAIMHTRPTTPAGLVVYTGWLRQEINGLGSLHLREVNAIFATLDDAARGMAGLQPWSPPNRPLPSDLGSAYEGLLRQFVDALVNWHAAPSKSSTDYDEASNAMCKIAARMEPLEEQIQALEIRGRDTDKSRLRTVALKDLRYKLPCFHDEWTISDGNSGDLEMFWQVLEFVGLADYARTIERRVQAAVQNREEAEAVG